MIQKFQSPAFSDGRPIPRRHAEDGEDVSPELAWSGLPRDTKELALIVDDPDAPRAEPWVHWVLYKIPADWPGLPEGFGNQDAAARQAGVVAGQNSWGSTGYRGPAPPQGHGVHHYHFKLYALDAPLEVGPGLDKKGLMDAMSGHVLAHGELVGTYQR